MKKLKEFYAKLPPEVTVFIEYILPSAILTALIQYLTDLEVSSVLTAGLINVLLIFLRELKPRFERLRK